LPGLSVAVAVDGEIVWTEGFGWTDIECRSRRSRASVSARSRLSMSVQANPSAPKGAPCHS
jgi:hypothetical protein